MNPKTSSLEAAVTAALGGPPMRPPSLPPQPIGGSKKAKPAPEGDAEARAAFTARHLPAEPVRTGNPTFDAPSPDILLRRARVAEVREKLSALIAKITTTADELTPVLDSLQADAPALQVGEQFNPALAREFLEDLVIVISSISEDPKPPAPPKPKPDSKS